MLTTLEIELSGRRQLRDGLGAVSCPTPRSNAAAGEPGQDGQLTAAKAGCGQALYRLNEATGAWLSTAALPMFKARREGGPRWDPQMSEADNQSYENLMLLCIPHASEIEDTHHSTTRSA